MFSERIMNQKGGMCRSFVMMEQPFFFHPQIKPSSSYCLSSSHSDNIPCAPSGYEVEIHDELHPHNQKTQSASLSHWTELAMLFLWSGFLFQNQSRKLKFHHLWQCSLKFFISICMFKKLLTDINTILFLIFTQQMRH
jgi:hypothetical protein